MSKAKFNRVQVLFNYEHKPYVYGGIHIVDGDIENQWCEKPFVISKMRPDGTEVVFGTVARTMEKIWSQLERLEAFRFEAEKRLAAAGVERHGSPTQLPRSPIADQVIDEQEALLEDVLVALSVHIRVLTEVFPKKLNRAKATVYDQDGESVGRIALSRIADLLLHNRYILIKDLHVVDLISDRSFMLEKPQLGLNINLIEYLGEVERALDDLAVSDLIGKLWGATKRLSSSSNVKDIVFLTQNLYTLGGLVLTDETQIEGGPLKSILDTVAFRVLDRPGMPRCGEVVQIPLVFGAPRFTLDPDLDNKQIRVSLVVNGKPEELVLGFEGFFAEVSKAHGHAKLRSSLRRKAPSQS